MLPFTSVDSLPVHFSHVVPSHCFTQLYTKSYVLSILLEPPGLLFSSSRLASMDHINNLLALAKDRRRKEESSSYVLFPFYDIPLGG